MGISALTPSVCSSPAGQSRQHGQKDDSENMATAQIRMALAEAAAEVRYVEWLVEGTAREHSHESLTVSAQQCVSCRSGLEGTIFMAFDSAFCSESCRAKGIAERNGRR